MYTLITNYLHIVVTLRELITSLSNKKNLINALVPRTHSALVIYISYFQNLSCSTQPPSTSLGTGLEVGSD